MHKNRFVFQISVLIYKYQNAKINLIHFLNLIFDYLYFEEQRNCLKFKPLPRSRRVYTFLPKVSFSDMDE